MIDGPQGELPKDKDPRFIECADHKFRRWSIVCIHLINGECHDWREVDQEGDDEMINWLCPTCVKRVNEGDHRIDDMRPCCVICVLKLRRKHDPNYENEKK